MPSLSDHHGSQFVKLMYIGNSGTGKTGSLTSLVKDGYKLRILDMDNGLDSLRMFVKKECPDKMGNIEYETCRDIYKASPMGPQIRGAPKAYSDSLKLMEKWSDGSDPSQWGADTIFVLDSLTALGRSAYEWARGMNPGAKEPRTWFYTAQQALENNVALLTGEGFHCNVIIISHVTWIESNDGTTKGGVSSIGKAIATVLPRYVNTLVLAESSGSGDNVKRLIKTMPTGAIDLKTPIPKVDKTLPLETGLSTLFTTLKDTNNA